MDRAALLFLICCLVLPATLTAQDSLEAIPWLSGRVVDQTNTLTGDQLSELESMLADLEERKGSQLVVAIVATTGPEAIESYSIRMAEEWRIGRAGVDDGVILLVAKEDRRLRIEVGYGLEGAIPDAQAKLIIDELIVPEFRNGNFYDGIFAGVEQLIRNIDGEPLPDPNYVSPEREAEIRSEISHLEWRFWFEDFTYVWMVVCLVLGLILCIRKKHVYGFLIPVLLYGIPVLALGLFFDDYFYDALLAILPYFFIYLVFLGIVDGHSGGGGSGSYRSTGSSFSSSSFSSSSSSFSSSSSSFSGGGGSFGGGGASGSW